jgi:hypothetical protein
MINDVASVTCFTGGPLQQRHGGFELAVFQSLESGFVKLDIHRSIVALCLDLKPSSMGLSRSLRMRIAHWELSIGQIRIQGSGFCQVIFALALKKEG